MERRPTSEYEEEFRRGAVPPAPAGPLAGTLLRTTMNPIADGLASAATSLWMPWRGKTFDPHTATGRNVFTPGFVPLMRVLWPSARELQPFDADHISAFGFRTWTGESALLSGVEVLKIDYGIPESPRFLIRSILDEVVQAPDGALLGQALVRWNDGIARAAWFRLEDRPIR